VGVEPHCAAYDFGSQVVLAFVMIFFDVRCDARPPSRSPCRDPSARTRTAARPRHRPRPPGGPASPARSLARSCIARYDAERPGPPDPSVHHRARDRAGRDRIRRRPSGRAPRDVTSDRFLQDATSRAVPVMNSEHHEKKFPESNAKVSESGRRVCIRCCVLPCVRTCGHVDSVRSRWASSLSIATRRIDEARPVWGSTSTRAPWRRGSPLATSKKWGTNVKVAARTRS
jgi:hypothetical protein